MPLDLREAALPAMRARLSDVWVPDLHEAIEDVLSAHYEEAIELMANNRRAELQKAPQRWKQELSETKRPFYLAMAQDGYDWAGVEFGDMTAINPEAGKEYDIPEIDPDLMPYRLVDGTDAFIKEMSEFESTTTRDQVIDRFSELRTDPEVYTPSQITTRLADAVKDFPTNRANSVTRTATIWTYNEGARVRYIEAGIKRFEWFATGDDRTCPFCISLDGEVVGTQETFADKGTSIEGIEGPAGGELDINWKVEHPPLHAFCRCTIVPVS